MHLFGVFFLQFLLRLSVLCKLFNHFIMNRTLFQSAKARTNWYVNNVRFIFHGAHCASSSDSFLLLCFACTALAWPCSLNMCIIFARNCQHAISFRFSGRRPLRLAQPLSFSLQYSVVVPPFIGVSWLLQLAPGFVQFEERAEKRRRSEKKPRFFL